MNWLGLFQSFVGPAIDYLDHRNERSARGRAQELDLDDARHQRRMTNISENRQAEVDWNTNAQNNSGYRDEWVTILLSIPLVMAFVPDMVQYVHAGFEALEKTPVWYQGGIGLMIASALGMQQYARWTMDRRTRNSIEDSNPTNQHLTGEDDR